MRDPSEAPWTDHVNRGFEVTASLVHSLHDEMRAELATLGARIHALESSSEAINRVLHSSNGGQKALVTQLAVLKNSVQHVADDLERVKRSREDASQEATRGRWQVLVALISSLSALGVALIQLLVR